MDAQRAGASTGAGGGEWQLHLKQQLVTATTKDATEENRGRKEDAAGGGKNAAVKSVNVSHHKVSALYNLFYCYLLLFLWCIFTHDTHCFFVMPIMHIID